MLEQKTAQLGIEAVNNGLHLAEQWGPIVTIVVVFVLYQIWYSFHMRDKAVTPVESQNKEIEKLRNAKGRMLDEINGIRIQLEKRITYDWLEKNLLSKMNSIESDIHTLNILITKTTASIEVGQETNRRFADNMEKLTRLLEEHSNRLIKLESR